MKNVPPILHPTSLKEKVLRKLNEVKKNKMKTSTSKKFIQRCIKNVTSFASLNKKKLTGRPVTVNTQTNNDVATQIIGDNNSVSLR